MPQILVRDDETKKVYRIYVARDQDGDIYLFVEEPVLKQNARGLHFWYAGDTTPAVRLYDAGRDELTPVGRVFDCLFDIDKDMAIDQYLIFESIFFPMKFVEINK